MKTAFGILNLHNSPLLGKLTEKRPLASVTFLGRYGLMDFTLSNFTNSGINKIEILVEKHLDSIRSHTQNGNVWVGNTRTGFLRSVINEDGLINPEQNTDIANIVQGIPLDIITEDYVVIAPANFLTKIDYRDVMKAHRDSGAGITVVYTETSNLNDYPGCKTLALDDDGEVRAFLKNDNREKSACVSIETFIISRDIFIGMIRFASEISNTKTTISNMVEIYAKNKMAKVIGYKHSEKVFPILNLKQYCDISFSMLEHKTRLNLFFDDWPIYTTTHNTPPSLYGEDANITNSIVSNGAVINGKVRNSIISREVTIEKGAVVENCIIMFRTIIGSDVHLDHVVTDKSVVIKNVKNLSGDDPDYLLISKGASI